MMSSKRIQAMARLIDEIGAGVIRWQSRKNEDSTLLLFEIATKIREYNRTFKGQNPKVKAESGEI